MNSICLTAHLYLIPQPAARPSLRQCPCQWRVQEDHEHVTTMHALVMQTHKNQDVEMAELKHILAILTGQEMTARAMEKKPDMKALHPRGEGRFAEYDISRRWQAGVYHNTMTKVIRDDLTAPEEY